MPTSTQILHQLAAYESPNVTFMAEDGRWPIVWDRARGTDVWDPEGRKYLDLTAAFGVAAAGHANPRVVAAAQAQLGRLVHAMGDVHPHPLKAQLARRLSQITFERWTAPRPRSSPPRSPPRPAPSTGKCILGSSGFEAVEVALKTALLATRRPGVIAFEGAYHGTGYGTLNTTHRDLFHAPFHAQLRRFGAFLPFPVSPHEVHRLRREILDRFQAGLPGAVLVEPVQGRGGIRVPPPSFLPLLRRLCSDHGVLLILDEIYTGFGRTGRLFACEHTGVVPDLICLGKALTGGFPLSACVGRADLIDAAWPRSAGEAIHTSTFLGHPVGCAMALAQIREIGARHLDQRSARLGTELLTWLDQVPAPPAFTLHARGLGLMAGLEIRHRDGRPATALVLAAITRLLHQGYLFLPEGADSDVISFTPPLTITRAALQGAVRALTHTLHDLAAE